MSMDEFRDVVGYNGIYRVSRDGTIEKVIGHKKGIIAQSTNHQGYKFLQLTLDGKRSNKKVHRLVAEAWITNPLNKPQVNHKDGVKSNNTLSNLEWVTSSENLKHAYASNLIPITAKRRAAAAINAKKAGASNRKITKEDSLQMKKHLKAGMSQRAVAKLFGCSQSTVRRNT